jgi:deoxyribodipyrimidine photo-lyase
METSSAKTSVSIFWFRRDLRLTDNAGLYQALTSSSTVQPVFIFDTNILDELEDKADSRVTFIHQALNDIQKKLLALGATVDVRYGSPISVFRELTEDYQIESVFTNHDYEPYAIERDKEIERYLKEKGIEFRTYKDQVLLEKNEVLKDDGKPYTVFTPYSRKWQSRLTPAHLKQYNTEKHFTRFYKQEAKKMAGLEEMGFKRSALSFPAKDVDDGLIRHYEEQRNYPAITGTSRLGVHLRFGTISIRELAGKTSTLSQTFVKELVWREFYQMILWHFPQVVTNSFKPEYDRIEWRNNEKEFDAWTMGNTGYAIVDAGMRELNNTGFMHNRLRMITASFLTKHLLIDWRWGEAYFAKKLLDYELASNNGGWQWAAGSGVDAAPYFRIFNPVLQTKKFDPKLEYIRKWVPEAIDTGFEESNYPKPIVDHEFARKRCIEVYSKAVKKF